MKKVYHIMKAYTIHSLNKDRTCEIPYKSKDIDASNGQKRKLYHMVFHGMRNDIIIVCSNLTIKS